MTTSDRNADQLPCGADVHDLIAQACDGNAHRRTAHQGSCPHCQAALAEYDRLLKPVHDLATERVHAPDTVLDEVLRRIRQTVSDPAYGMIPSPRGDTRIAGRVVAVTARVTTEQVPGVRVALARRNTAQDAEAADAGTVEAARDVVAGVSGASTALSVTVAADYGTDLHALADRIRRAVTRAVRSLTGLEPVEITIVIDDVLEPLETPETP